MSNELLGKALSLSRNEQYRLAFQIAENIGCEITKPLPRETIIALIHEHYDPEPKDWPRHRGWDDGTGDIADKIIAAFQHAVQTVETCPECGLKADTLLHKFCTRRYCHTR